YRISAVMLFGHVVKVSAKFLPFDDSEGRVQSVQFGNLDVLGIFIGCFAIRKCYAAADVVSLICIAGRNRNDPSERIVFTELDSHTYVDERYAPFLQSFND